MQDGSCQYLLIVEVNFPLKRTITHHFDVPAGPGVSQSDTDGMAARSARDFVRLETEKGKAASLQANLYKQIPFSM